MRTTSALTVFNIIILCLTPVFGFLCTYIINTTISWIKLEKLIDLK